MKSFVIRRADGSVTGSSYLEPGERTKGLEEYAPSWSSRPVIKGRKLIYMVAIGAAYMTMAKMLIKSLRHHGYDDDILIFSDVRCDLGDVEIRPLSYLFSCGKAISPKIMCGRDIREAADYERIMFLDCDILCLKPMETMFSSEVFNYCRHAACSIRSHGHQDALSHEGLLRSKDEVTVNGGTFGASGKDFLAIMEDCLRIMVEKPLRIFAKRWVSEEAALVWVAYDGKWASEPYSMSDFNFGHSPHASPDPVFMHYTCKKQQMFDDFERIKTGATHRTA